jgi:hypothetical protein
MAKLSRTNFTAEQEVLVRDFLDDAAELETALPPEVVGGLLYAMGYRVLAPGKIVRRDREIKHIFGDPDPYRNIEDEYGPDGDALRASLDSADTDETDTSVEAESDEVGDVLQQDVQDVDTGSDGDSA